MRRGTRPGSAVRAGLGYTAGNLFVKSIAFLTLPLFSRMMTAAQFGVYNVFISYEAILYVLVGFALDLSLQNALLDYRERIHRYISSISLIYLINAAVLCAAAFFANGVLSAWLQLDGRLLYLLVIYSCSTAIISLYNMKVSLRYAYRRYLLVAFANAAANVVLSVILMLTVFGGRREYGRIAGATLAAAASAVWVLVSFYRDAPPRFSREFWRYGLRYSLPLVPHGVSQVLLAQFDRVMVRAFCGDAAAGVYSLAANLRLVLTVITNSVITAWRTWFFRAMADGKTAEIRRRARQLVELYALLTVGMMSVSHELVFLVGGQPYDAAKWVAVPMLGDAFLLFVYSVVVQSEYYAKKTAYVMIGTLVAAAVDIAANLVFIPRFGFAAAAYTTLFAYVVYLALHLVISRRAAGFPVVRTLPLCLLSALVTAVGAFDLVYADAPVLRLAVCLAVVVPLGLHLLRDTGRI